MLFSDRHKQRSDAAPQRDRLQNSLINIHEAFPYTSLRHATYALCAGFEVCPLGT